VLQTLQRDSHERIFFPYPVDEQGDAFGGDLVAHDFGDRVRIWHEFVLEISEILRRAVMGRRRANAA